MRIVDNKGNTLIYIVIAMTMLSALGLGIYRMTTAATQQQLNSNNFDRAYALARTGIRHAASTCVAGTYTLANGDRFVLTGPAGGGSGTWASTGIVSLNTPFEAKRAVSMAIQCSVAHVTDFTDGWVVNQSQGDAITISESGTVADLGQIGEAHRYKFGVLLYGGNNPSGNCTDGKCDFGSGFRAYFVFKFDSSSAADGFTFLFMNGADNDKTSVGGDSAMGEMMAYSGDSRAYVTADGSYGQGRVGAFLDGKGLGLRSPKAAIEFDTYYNGCNDVCTSDSGSNDSSRCDPNDRDHTAYLFWGDTTDAHCKERQYLRWQPSITYPLGTVAFPVADNGYLYRVITSGTAGTTEPTWPTAKGGTVTRDGVQWKECRWRPNTAYGQYEIVSPTVPTGYLYEMYRLGTRTTGNTEPDWTVCTPTGNCTGDGGARWRVKDTTSFPGSSATYDDNRHGAGTGSNPANSTAATSYFDNDSDVVPNGSSWLVGTTYAFRMEVNRSTNGDSTGTYRVRSWLKRCTDGTVGCDMHTNAGFGNTSLDYVTDTNQPFLDRTIALNSSDHLTKFNKFLFGFSEATGAATQNAKIRKFRLNFKP